jgi:hypothetical protein
MDDNDLLHDDEIPIDDVLARHLVESQFPEWSNLPIRRVRSRAQCTQFSA